MSVTRQDNGRWRARWRGPDGRERARVFDTKTAARAWESDQARDVRQGSYVDPADGKVTVSDYSIMWERQQHWRPSTRDRTVSVLDVHIRPTFGDLPLSAVRPSAVRSWVAGMTTDELKPATVAANYHVLRQMLKAAVTDGLIRSNPCDGVKLPRIDRRLIVPLTAEQVAAIADKIRPDLYAAVWLAATSGIRQGELLGVTADRVHWLRRELVIDRQMLTPGTGAPRFAPVKSDASNRIVPLPDEIVTMLGEHVEVFGTGPGGLLFAQDGTPWRRSRLNTAWRTAKIAAGVEARFHDLRHYAASTMIADGVSVKGVQAVLGHATAVETLDTYSHLWPADQDRARQAMARGLPDFADFPRTATAD